MTASNTLILTTELASYYHSGILNFDPVNLSLHIVSACQFLGVIHWFNVSGEC